MLYNGKKLCFDKLKTIPAPSIMIDTKWETVPLMDLNWIIKHIDNLYVIYLQDTTDNNREIIGFMLYNKSINNLINFELVEQYRHKGICSHILSTFNSKGDPYQPPL